MSDKLLVRIKPYNPGQGCVVRSFSTRFREPNGSYTSSYRFLVESGWYELPRHYAEQLKYHVHQDSVLHSPPVFDVMDREAAINYEREEKLAAERGKAAAAQRMAAREGAVVPKVKQIGTLTTADLQYQDEVPKPAPANAAAALPVAVAATEPPKPTLPPVNPAKAPVETADEDPFDTGFVFEPAPLDEGLVTKPDRPAAKRRGRPPKAK